MRIKSPIFPFAQSIAQDDDPKETFHDPLQTQ